MAVPAFRAFLLPLLKLASDEKEHSIPEAIDHMARTLNLAEPT